MLAKVNPALHPDTFEMVNFVLSPGHLRMDR